MRAGETELEMVQRHVTDGEKIICAQRTLIADLASKGACADDAAALLAVLLQSQSLHLEHLMRLQNR